MDRKRFPEFYKKNVQRIYRFLYYRVGGNTEIAQDLTQDVFLKALEAFERYDATVSESAWIFTIARNHLLNHVAKAKPGVTLEEIENTCWDRDDWSLRAEISHDERRVLDALKVLSTEDADLVRRKYLEGWGYDEIAHESGKSAGALRVQSFRALRELRKILKRR